MPLPRFCLCALCWLKLCFGGVCFGSLLICKGQHDESHTVWIANCVTVGDIGSSLSVCRTYMSWHCVYKQESLTSHCEYDCVSDEESLRPSAADGFFCALTWVAFLSFLCCYCITLAITQSATLLLGLSVTSPINVCMTQGIATQRFTITLWIWLNHA